MKAKRVSIRKNRKENLLYDHIVFHTKYNRLMLKGKIRSRAKEIIIGILDDLGCKVIEIDVQPNHVHVLFGFPPRLTPSKIINRIKGTSSYLLRKEFPILVEQCPKALWQIKVAHVSVGNEMNKVISYIRNQGPHHGYED